MDLQKKHVPGNPRSKKKTIILYLIDSLGVRFHKPGALCGSKGLLNPLDTHQIRLLQQHMRTTHQLPAASRPPPASEGKEKESQLELQVVTGIF